MEINKQLILTVAPSCREPDVVVEKLNMFLPQYNINTPLRVMHFISQIAHESNFNPIEENLGEYTAKNLVTVFPKYFPSYAFAASYVGSAAAIGNRVYANRMGNGKESSGDGYRYRGRGYIQLTGKSNYIRFGNAIGYDLVNNPDLALQHGISTLVACEFFKQNNILPYCDRNDREAVSRIVNTGTAKPIYKVNGLEDRYARFNRGWYYLQSVGVV